MHMTSVRRGWSGCRTGGCAAVLLLLAPLVPAHEVDTNRLTLVQRDARHLALTFYVDYVGLLARTLAPGASRAEFTALCAAMPDERLRLQLRQAHALFERAVDIRTAAGERLRLAAFRWPEFRDARRVLRDEATQSVVGAATHVHASPTEIFADALSTTPADDLRVVLPPALGTVVVVSYRPVQERVAADRGQVATVRF